MLKESFHWKASEELLFSLSFELKNLKVPLAIDSLTQIKSIAQPVWLTIGELDEDEGSSKKMEDTLQIDEITECDESKKSI